VRSGSDRSAAASQLQLSSKAPWTVP